LFVDTSFCLADSSRFVVEKLISSVVI
jgi:hypothetical protein